MALYKNVKICIEGVDLEIIRIKRSWLGRSVVVIKDPDGTVYQLYAGDTLSLKVAFSMRNEPEGTTSR